MRDVVETASQRRRRRVVPLIGTVAGAAVGFAFYWFYGCDSG